jgi:dTMP kinase
MVETLNQWTMYQTEPDLVVYLEIDIQTALSRVQKRGSLSIFEKPDFLSRVKKGFDENFKDRTNVLKIDSNDTLEKVFNNTFEQIYAWLTTNNYLV